MIRVALFYIFVNLCSVWFTIPAFCIQSAMKSQVRKPWEIILYSLRKMRVKRAGLILVLFCESFDLMDPLKESQGSSGVLKLKYTLRATPIFSIVRIVVIIDEDDERENQDRNGFSKVKAESC